MAMTNVDPIDAMIAAEEQEVRHVEVGAVAAITKSEAEAQIDAAHKYPRSTARFLKESITLATISQDVAESCIYSLPRDGKLIAGPSVRLAEIAASAYGNLHYGARVVDEEDRNIVAQGICWDIERNVRVTLEVKRRITNRNGRRFSDDMITMTGNAAASIALRNAIFRVVPRAYINSIYDRVRQVAVGNAKTLDTKREQVLERLNKIGVSTERVLAKLEKHGIEDVGLEDLEILIGLGTAIKDGAQSIDEAFPVAAPAPAAPSEDGKRISMRGKKGKATDAESEEPDREPGEEG